MPSDAKQFLLDLELPHSGGMHNPLIERISKDPFQFMSNPDLSGVSERHFRETYEYFMSPDPDRLTFSVCTHLFKKDKRKISKQLIAWNHGDGSFRCFPFVYGGAPNKNEHRSIEHVGSQLLEFWNKDSSIIFRESSKVIDPILAQQNGQLSILDQKQVGDFYLYRNCPPKRGKKRWDHPNTPIYDITPTSRSSGFSNGFCDVRIPLRRRICGISSSCLFDSRHLRNLKLYLLTKGGVEEASVSHIF
jgi:hypothetical protein